MSATKDLRSDHINVVDRLRKITYGYAEYIYEGNEPPVDDIKGILAVIEGFISMYHHYKEECSYFPRVNATELEQEANALKIEHELGRRIAVMLNSNLERWLSSKNNAEPIARMLKAYADYLTVHMEREERFFDAYDARVSEDEQKKIKEEFYRIKEERMPAIDKIIEMVNMLEERLEELRENR